MIHEIANRQWEFIPPFNWNWYKQVDICKDSAMDWLEFNFLVEKRMVKRFCRWWSYAG